MNKYEKSIVKKLLNNSYVTLRSILTGGTNMKNCITWLELYNELGDKANKIKHFGKFNWGDAVVFRNEETGDEFPLSLEETEYADGSTRLILVCNYPRYEK